MTPEEKAELEAEEQANADLKKAKKSKKAKETVA